MGIIINVLARTAKAQTFDIDYPDLELTTTHL